MGFVVLVLLQFDEAHARCKFGIERFELVREDTSWYRKIRSWYIRIRVGTRGLEFVFND